VRVVVTGSAGFIGSHLCRELEDRGHEVHRHDVASGGVAQDLLVCPKHFAERIAWLKPDVVVHLAAKVGRLFGEDDVAKTIADNALMTTIVARACGDTGVRLAYASTSEVYGDRGDVVAVEDELYSYEGLDADGEWYWLGGSLPHNLYGLSKRWGEEACRLYAPDRLTTWRISMPYGPGLPAGRGRAAICNFLDQAARGVSIPVHAGAERSWCWIGDTVRALALTLERTDGGAWNVGRDDDARPMSNVAKLACDVVGADPGLIYLIPAPLRQTVVKRLSTEKIRTLGWTPEVDLEEGIERLWAWLSPQVAA
jgi:dTDP-glucose 4,6-dehydratase